MDDLGLTPCITPYKLLKAQHSELYRILKVLTPSACFRCPACVDRTVCRLKPSVSITAALGHCEVAEGCPIVRALEAKKGRD